MGLIDCVVCFFRLLVVGDRVLFFDVVCVFFVEVLSYLFFYLGLVFFFQQCDGGYEYDFVDYDQCWDYECFVWDGCKWKDWYCDLV